MATTLGAVAEGSIVYLNESGVAVPFYVAKHNYESALNGSGRTLLVRRDVSGTSMFSSSSGNIYAGGYLDTYFNETWFLLLDSVIQNAAGTTKFYYTPGGGDNSVTTLERAAFALSLTELGLSATGANIEGSAVPVASVLQIAYLNGSATEQWTRSPSTSNTARAWELKTGGTANDRSITSSRGARPALTLPAHMGVDDSGNITEPKAAATSLANIDGTSVLLTGCLANVGGIEYAIPYALANVDGIEVTIPFGPQYEVIEAVPYQTGTLTYTGSAQEPIWADYDDTVLDIGGTTTAANAGTYTATFTPVDGYVWADTGDASTKSVTWSIGKAAGKVTVSPSMISLGVGESTTATVSRLGDGALSVTSNNTSVATGTISGSTLTIRGVALGGPMGLIVTAAEGTNHLAASLTVTVSVKVSYTVTISRYGNYSNNANYAYFQINGTKYPGSASSTTLTVPSGTAYTAFAKIYNNATSQYVGIIKVDGTTVTSSGGSHTGTITGNTTVKLGYMSSGNISLAQVEITTS